MIYVSDPDFTLYVGDVLDVLRGMPDESAHMCVTSPPYWGLRDYGMDGQLGLEATPEEFVARMVEVFAEVRRVLRADGTCWLNIGSSYFGNPGGPQGATGERASRTFTANARSYDRERHSQSTDASGTAWVNFTQKLKPKDMVPIPWMLAMALQEDGWYLRSDIIWAKPNPMPESVTDRPTKAHEYLFLLTKSARYFYDAGAIRDAVSPNSDFRPRPDHATAYSKMRGINPSETTERLGNGSRGDPSGRNKRSVWEIATESYPDAHFATFPQALVEPCVKAGSPEGGTVLDPFMGSGTTALVARRLGRKAVGIELNPDYAKLAAKRLSQLSLLAEDAA